MLEATKPLYEAGLTACPSPAQPQLNTHPEPPLKTELMCARLYMTSSPTYAYQTRDGCLVHWPAASQLSLKALKYPIQTVIRNREKPWHKTVPTPVPMRLGNNLDLVSNQLSALLF